MKKLLIILALAGFIGLPLAAQEGSEGDDEWGAEGESEARTPQEMLAELHRLMKKASVEMEELEKELAKASLDAPKADVVAERIKQAREAMAKGEIDKLPEGLRKYIQENPEEAAEATGKTEDEIRKIASDSKKLEELLKKNPELLKKLADNEGVMEKVLEHQHQAEKRLAETLKRQRESSEAARKKVDESMEMAHAIRQQGQGHGEGKPKDNDQSTKDPRKKDPKQGDGKPSTNAPEAYKPGEGEKPRDDQSEEYRRAEADGWTGEKKSKEMGNGAGSSGDTNEPSKYKGFWEKFTREMQKKIKERKSAEKK